jgi:hypothetical protein
MHVARTRGAVRRRRARLAAACAGLLLALTAVGGILGLGDPGPGDVPVVPATPGSDAGAVPDPYAWDPGRSDEFVRRAAAGTSHLLYRLSPGGVIASAARTARWRPQVEQAAKAAGVKADTLEGLVFLESAGRPDAQTPGGIEGAVGLTQILAETGHNLLGMHVDTGRSSRDTRRIARALRKGQAGKAAKLEKDRARADERFDPAKSLQATARYLKLARAKLGREDLAFVSYHMGIGNLQNVLAAFAGGDDVSYARLYFDSTPRHHAAAYRKLASFGDDSSNYLWKLYAAREIMRLYRDDRTELERLDALHAAKNSAEEVLHPDGSDTRFADPSDLREAWDRHDIRVFPNLPKVTGLARDPRMGELAGRLGEPTGLYRGLKPPALAMALYIGAQVRELSGGASPLVVTSTVRDERYQRLLVRRNREATRNYSLHTTGWAFDVERRYRSGAQARAFQFVLDRLQVLGAIAWVREPDAIHITASRDAESLLPLLDRLEHER